MVSTLSIKNLQKPKKNICYFQTPTIFVLELKESWKPFSNKVPMTKFSFTQFLMFCITFPENGFNFVAQKLQKNWKFPFSNVQNIHFLSQGHFKTVSQKSCHDQLWIYMVRKALSCFFRKWFQLSHSKFAKIWKIPFPNAQNIFFWVQGSLKTMF